MASSPVRFLANAGGSDDTSLGLKKFWGRADEAFRTSTFLWNAQTPTPIVARKDVSPGAGGGGKSFQFLMMSDMPRSEVHTPGDTLLGQQFEFDEGEVSVDKFIVSHASIPLDQRMIAHWDVVEPVATKLGSMVGREMDRRAFITAVKACRTNAVGKNSLLIHGGGNTVSRTGSATISTAYPDTNRPLAAARLRDDLRALAYRFAQDFVPRPWYLFLDSYFESILTADVGYVWGTPSNTANAGPSTLWSRDYGSSNDLHSMRYGNIDGFTVVAFVNPTSLGGPLPDENITTGPSKYQINCSGSGAYASNTSSAATIPFTVPSSANPAGSTSDVSRPVAIAFGGTAQGQAPIGVATYGSLMAASEDLIQDNVLFCKAQILAGWGVMHPWTAGYIGISSS